MRILRAFRDILAVPGVRYVMVFMAVFAIYGIIQTAAPTFLDPDSFYHLKVTQLLMERGVEREFTWLPFTTLGHAYADHHFLYHVLLIPFLAAFGPFYGVKVATAFFGAVAGLAFYSLLRALNTRWAVVFTLLLATSSSFMYRMNLAKTSSLSVALLMLSLLAIVRNKPWALFGLSFAYVWLYGGWPIMLVIVGIFIMARAMTDAAFATHPVHSWAAPWFWRRLFSRSHGAVRDFFRTAEVRFVLAAGGGVTLGLIANPYFPQNLRFYWEQIVQIALLGYKDKIGVGMEWYPFPAWRLLLETGVVFILAGLALALLCAMVFWSDVTRRSKLRLTRAETGVMIATTTLGLLFLLLTMRSRRHVEYFVPFSMLALSQAWTLLLARLDVGALRKRLATLIPRFSALPIVLATYGVVILVFLGARDVWQVRESFSNGIPWNKYEAVGKWVKANVPEGDVIIHSDWDDFPMLFLHNDRNRYIAGLDATFLYRQDPERYWAWVNMTIGKTSAMAETAVSQFGSYTMVIENDHTRMRDMAEADPRVHKAYQDDYAAVYVISRD